MRGYPGRELKSCALSQSLIAARLIKFSGGLRETFEFSCCPRSEGPDDGGSQRGAS